MAGAVWTHRGGQIPPAGSESLQGFEHVSPAQEAMATLRIAGGRVGRSGVTASTAPGSVRLSIGHRAAPPARGRRSWNSSVIREQQCHPSAAPRLRHARWTRTGGTVALAQATVSDRSRGPARFLLRNACSRTLRGPLADASTGRARPACTAFGRPRSSRSGLSADPCRCATRPSHHGGASGDARDRPLINQLRTRGCPPAALACRARRRSRGER